MITIASQGGWHGLHAQTGMIVLGIVLAIGGIGLLAQDPGGEAALGGCLMLLIGIVLLGGGISFAVTHGQFP
jgi:hypothetical protein